MKVTSSPQPQKGRKIEGRGNKKSPLKEGRGEPTLLNHDKSSSRGSGSPHSIKKGGLPIPKGLEARFESLKHLMNMPETSKATLFSRLLFLPREERTPAMLTLLVLEKRGISLDDNSWQELWGELKKGSVETPRDEKEVRELFQRGQPYPAQESEESVSLRFFKDKRGEGQVVLTLAHGGSGNLFIRLNTSRRKWEFHLVGAQKGGHGGESKMTVFTDDLSLVENPPKEWQDFCETLKKYAIFVERRIKNLINDSFLSDNDNKVECHFVDILL